MNTNLYSTEVLRAYLLGNASAADAANIDELSVTDNEFAGLLDAAETDLLDAYLNQEIVGKELQRFEGYYLSTARGTEKLRFAEVFKEYSSGRRVESAASERPASTNRIGSLFASIFSFWSRPFAYRFAAVTAVVLAAAFISWLALRDTTDRSSEVAANIDTGLDSRPTLSIEPQPPAVSVPKNADSSTSVTPSPTPIAPQTRPNAEKAARPVIATFVLAPPLRGADVPEFRLPPGADRASFRLEVESEDLANYNVELRKGANGPVIWRARRLKAVSGSLKLDLPAAILKNSLYSFSVSGTSKSGQTEKVGDYAFRIVQ